MLVGMMSLLLNSSNNKNLGFYTRNVEYVSQIQIWSDSERESEYGPSQCLMGNTYKITYLKMMGLREKHGL